MVGVKKEPLFLIEEPMRKFSTLALLAALLTGPALAQDHQHDPSDPEVLAAEVYRRGNLVEDTETVFDGPQWAAMQVTQVPEDDSHKWFISLITKQGCQPCERLKSDFVRSPYLSCWASPTDRNASWAHYNVYNGDDATQVARWKNVRISAYPTVIIQPPRSGQFGPSSTVVFQKTGYDGDPKKLGADIRSALTRYAEKHYRAEHREDQPTQEELAEDPSGHAQSPPFPVPAPVNPIPSVFPPDGNVNIPPPAPDDPANPTEPGDAPVVPWLIAVAALAFALARPVAAMGRRARAAIVSDLARELKPAPRRSARK